MSHNKSNILQKDLIQEEDDDDEDDHDFNN